MVAAKVAIMPHGGDYTSEQGANLRIAQVSQPDAAALVNVSRRSVQAAAKVRKQGTAELVAVVEDGVLPVSVAAQAAELPQATQQAVARPGGKDRAGCGACPTPAHGRLATAG